MLNFRTTATQGCIALALPFLLLTYLFLIWPGLSGPFLFDDFPNLENLNALWRNGSGPHIGDYIASFKGIPGRPLSALSFLLNDMAWPSDPFAFKYTNVMLHLLNGVLLFGLIRLLARHARCLPSSDWFALTALAIWLFHPLFLSAQLLAVQRMTVLSASFCLAGLWIYAKLLLSANSFGKSLLAAAVLGLFTLLAILSKENGALLPAFAWVIQATLWREVLAEKSPIVRHFSTAAVAIPSVAIALLILYSGLQHNAYSGRQFDLTERLLTQIHVIPDYLRQILLPTLADGGIYHDDYPITRSLFDSASTTLLALLLLAISSLALWKFKQWPLVAFAILWFFVGHAMESTVIPLELYFEHRNYLPAIGPLMAIAALPFMLKSYQKTVAFMLAGWFCFLIALTTAQARLWGNWEMLATVWSAEHPMSQRAAQEMANYQLVSGQPEQAIKTYLAGHQRGINTPDLILSALYVSCIANLPENSNWLEQSLEKIKTAPYNHGSFSMLQNLRMLTTSESCPEIFDRSDWFLISEAYLANPKFRKHAEDFIRLERARAFLDNGQTDLAIVELAAAYKINPSIELSQKIATLMITLKRLDEAKHWLQSGLNLQQPWLKQAMSSQREQSQALLKAVNDYQSTHPTQN